MKMNQVQIVAVAALAASASAQVDKVTLRFDGLSCPFCVFNVDKQVKKVEGVDSSTPVENDLNRGLVWFAWNPERAFDPSVLREAADDSGFTLREIRVSGEGRVHPPSEPHPEQIRLTASADKASDAQRDIFLVRNERADRQEAWDALRALASDDAGQSATVRVDGTVVGEGSLWRVVLHGWSPVQYGAIVDAQVEGFSCERCSTRAMVALRSIDGVIHAQADHETGRVQVWTASDAPDVARIKKRIETLGFSVRNMHAHEHAQGDGHVHDHGGDE